MENDAMTDQLSFAPHLTAPSRPVDTSQEAARKITPRLGELHRKVLQTLQEAPRTADAVALALGEHPMDIRPRLSELRKMGLVDLNRGEDGKVIRGLSARGNEQATWCLRKTP